MCLCMTCDIGMVDSVLVFSYDDNMHTLCMLLLSQAPQVTPLTRTSHPGPCPDPRGLSQVCTRHVRPQKHPYSLFSWVNIGMGLS
jgi:hypothetical protein